MKKYNISVDNGMTNSQMYLQKENEFNLLMKDLNFNERFEKSLILPDIDFSRTQFANLISDIFTFYRVVRNSKEKNGFWTIGKDFQLIQKDYEINKNQKPLVTSNLHDSEFYDNNPVLFKLNKDKNLYLDSTEETDDGDWPEINDWINFMENINKNESDAILDFYFSEEKNECVFDNFTLIRINETLITTPDFQKLKLVFDTPQKFIFGEIGFGNNKEFVTKEISEIYCNFTYECYWYADNSKAKQKKYCNIIEIYLTDIFFIK